MTTTLQPRPDWLARLRSVMVLRPGQRVAHVPGIGVSTSRRAVSSGVSNGLLNALIAYWPGNEASGNLQDAHTNALHLTDVNTVTSETGLVYATSRRYSAAMLERHERPGDDALLSMGVVDCTLAAWVYLISNVNATIIAKYSSTGTSRGYLLEYYQATNRFAFGVRNTANTANTWVVANNFGAVSTATWYCVIASHDATGDLLSISVNAGTPDTASYANNILDDDYQFMVGGAPSRYYSIARIGPCAVWKSAGGGGGVLTADQRTALYNAGAGLPYASFTA